MPILSPPGPKVVAPQAESSAPWHKTVKQDDQHADLGNQSGEQRMKQLTNRQRPTMEMSRIDSDYSMVSFWPPGHIGAWWFSISDD